MSPLQFSITISNQPASYFPLTVFGAKPEDNNNAFIIKKVKVQYVEVKFVLGHPQFVSKTALHKFNANMKRRTCVRLAIGRSSQAY